jgi:hypothetical protein
MFRNESMWHMVVFEYRRFRMIMHTVNGSHYFLGQSFAPSIGMISGSSLLRLEQ